MFNIDYPIIQSYVALIGCTMLLASCSLSSAGNGYCVNPAPMEGTYNAAMPGYIVVFNEGVVAATEVNRLNTFYEWRVGAIYQTTFAGFFVEMSNTTLEQLRCEKSIKHIEYNASVTIVNR